MFRDVIMSGIKTTEKNVFLMKVLYDERGSEYFEFGKFRRIFLKRVKLCSIELSLLYVKNWCNSEGSPGNFHKH